MTRSDKAATPSDAYSVVHLIKDLLAELGDSESLSDTNKVIQLCRDLIEGKEYVAFLAFDSNSKASGVITLSEAVSVYAGGRFGVIREPYIVPNLRSSGRGAQLVQTAIDYGLESNWRRIEVSVPPLPEWDQTRGFYLRQDFKDIGPRLKLGLL
jgi:GNAT superfamily N-acetyltransferase